MADSLSSAGPSVNDDSSPIQVAKQRATVNALGGVEEEVIEHEADALPCVIRSPAAIADLSRRGKVKSLSLSSLVRISLTDPQCVLMIGGDVAKRILPDGQTKMSLNRSVRILLGIYKRAGNHAFYEYSGQDFAKDAEDDRFLNETFKVFTHFLENGGETVWSLREGKFGKDTMQASDDDDEIQHAFTTFAQGEELYGVGLYPAAIAMRSDAAKGDGEWLAQGPARFFLDEQMWEYQLAAVLLLFTEHLEMSGEEWGMVEQIREAVFNKLTGWSTSQALYYSPQSATSDAESM